MRNETVKPLWRSVGAEMTDAKDDTETEAAPVEEEVETGEDTDLEDSPAPPAEDQRYGVPVREAFGDQVLFPGIDDYEDLFGELKEDGFTSITDLFGVDYLHHQRNDLPASVTPERFEVVVSLLSQVRRERVRIRLQVAEGTEVPSLFDLFPGSEALERETFDMFGIVFANHPDMSRILMPETWTGHPLRKDYDIGAIPVQFKGAPGRT